MVGKVPVPSAQILPTPLYFGPLTFGRKQPLRDAPAGSFSSTNETWNQANNFIHKSPFRIIHIHHQISSTGTNLDHDFGIDKKLSLSNYLVKIFNTRTRQKQRKCVVSRRFLCRWQPLNWRTMLCDSFHLWSLWWSLCEFSEFSRNPPSWEPPVSQALAKLSGKVHVWQLHTLSQPQEHSSRGSSCSNLCWQTTWRNFNGDKIGLLCFVCPENTNH